ncbi:hypothetical protein U1Q18_020731 [Sarracenia purpurea var. burkii]
MSCNGTRKQGLVTFWDGCGRGDTDCCRFGSFFEGHLGHITALLEYLFVASNVSSLACVEKLKERNWKVPKIYDWRYSCQLGSVFLSRISLQEQKTEAHHLWHHNETALVCS